MKKIVVIASVMLFGFIQANAVGTTYNTDITNSATLNYQVGGNDQTAVVSNTDTFKVDRKVDVLVATTDNANIIVQPGDNVAADNTPLTFTVTNETNGNQDFILSALNLADGTASLDAGKTDNIDFGSDVKICTDATCSAGDISGTNQSFTEDETKTYYVFADIPLGTADGSIASIALTATAVDDGTTTPMTDDSGTADDPTTVQVVFAEDAGVVPGDAQYDGKHSALSAYEVVTATVDATKTSCVVSDPVNTTNNPKRIPGAVIRYAIDINNTGSADATNVVLTDSVAAEFGTSATALEVRSGPCPAVANPCAAKTGTVENNAGTTGGGTSSVTLDYGTVESNSHNCGYFDVTIQ